MGKAFFLTNAIEFYQAVPASSSRSCILLSTERLNTGLRTQSNDKAMLFLETMLLGKSCFFFLMKEKKFLLICMKLRAI